MESWEVLVLVASTYPQWSLAGTILRKNGRWRQELPFADPEWDALSLLLSPIICWICMGGKVQT